VDDKVVWINEYMVRFEGNVCENLRMI